MESNNVNVDISSIYFTDTHREYNNNLDAKGLVDDDNSIQEIVFDSTTNTYNLISDLDLSKYIGHRDWNMASGDYILELDSGQTFDGNNNRIYIPNDMNCHALFNIGNILNKYDTPIIKNTIIDCNGTYNIGNYCNNTGILVGDNIRFIHIINCNIKNVHAITFTSGGICGRFLGHNYGHAIIDGCSVSVKMIGYGSGGLCSSFAANDYGNVLFNNCTIDISEDVISDSSGICSFYAGSDSGTIVVSDCKITIGNDLRLSSAGICSSFGAVNGGEISILKSSVLICGNIGTDTNTNINDPSFKASCIVTQSDNTGGIIGTIIIDRCDVSFYGSIGDTSYIICEKLININLYVHILYINTYFLKYDVRLLIKKLNKDIVQNVAILHIINDMMKYAIDNDIFSKVIDDTSGIPSLQLQNIVVNGKELSL